MPFILNIETATEICSVCISKNGDMLALQENSTPNAHAKQITKLVEKCLTISGINLKDLDAVAVSAGPGSYTGLRIGASTAKGICYALNKPLIAVDTLQSLAWASRDSILQNTLYVPMIDARRMEVYLAVYDNSNQIIECVHSHILEKDSFSEYLKKGFHLVISGNGSDKCRAILSHREITYKKVKCSASNLVFLAHEKLKKKLFEDPAYFSPFYYKLPNITTPKKNIL